MSALDGGAAADWRHKIYGSGREPNRDDIAALIEAGRKDGDNPTFAALLSEAALDVFVNQVDPSGYISDADATWLIDHLSLGEGLGCESEFQLLKTLIGHALSIPQTLTAFAVRQVEKAILTGRRNATGGVDHEPGVVTNADIEALRALAFAPTRGHSLHVDRETAEALFDIAHATATAENAQAFPDFFAQAIGNYLMGADFLGTPDADEVLKVEAELARPGGFGAFFAAVFSGKRDLGASLESISDVQEEDDRAINDETDRRLETASHIQPDAAKWIIAHLTRGGELTLAERRLLSFLRKEAASAPPELEALYDQAA